MLRSFRSLLGSGPPAASDAPVAREAHSLPQPEHTTYLVGDLHGRADLLELMLELIDAHIGGAGSVDPRLVFLGDYIDHGPSSAGVIARLMELTNDFPRNVTCLMGCHERMLLDFLDDPTLRGPRWLRNGGAATLDSYGLHTTDLSPGSAPLGFQDAAARLAKALGPKALRWLQERPLSWSSGNLWAVHAGADPLRAMPDQSSRVLLWGHPEFDSTERNDGLWVAHGHVERQAAWFGDGRISLDTAAWSSGHLTACAVNPNGSMDLLET